MGENVLSSIGAIGAVVVAVGTALRQYLKERSQTKLEHSTGRETLIDARINAHFERLDSRVDELERENRELEARVHEMSIKLDAAIAYIRLNNLPWPPPEGWGVP